MAIKINGVTVVDDSRVGDLVRLNVSSTAADAVAIAGGMDVTKDLQIGGNLSVTGTITGSITGTAPKWSTARTVTFAGGDVTGAFTIDGSADVPDIALTVAANSVALGTDTTGNYVATIGSGTPGTQTGTSGLTISAVAGEGTAATISHAATSTLNGAQGTTGIASITVDGFGHITAVTTANYITELPNTFLNAAIAIDSGYTWGTSNTNTTQTADSTADTITFVQGKTGTTAGINLYTSTIAGTDAIKIEHADTSTLSGAQGTAGIVSITVDEMGHITAVTTATYLTAEADTLQTVTGRSNTTSTTLLITNTTESTTVDTGALQVDGGVGINKNLYVGGTLTLSSTGAVKLPVGTTAQQPAGVTGFLRFNSQTSSFEGFNGTVWGAIGGASTATVWLDKGTVVSGTVTFVVGTAGIQRLQVGGTLTIATSTWPTTGTYGELILELVNGGSSAVTWPAAINWIKSDGTVTTTFSSSGVTLQTSGTDWVTLWSRNAGTTIYGKVVR